MSVVSVGVLGFLGLVVFNYFFGAEWVGMIEEETRKLGEEIRELFS